MASSKISRKSIPAASEQPISQAVASASPRPPRKPAARSLKSVQAAPVEKVAVKAPVTKASAPPRAPRVAKPVVENAPFVPQSPPSKSGKFKPAKLVRDSYTMPHSEHALIDALKKRCLNLGMAAKKSEVLRAALAVLARLSDAEVAAAIKGLAVIKTGRPAKNAK